MKGKRVGVLVAALALGASMVFSGCAAPGAAAQAQPAQNQATATPAATPSASPQQGNPNNGQGKIQANANHAWLGVSVQSADGGGARVISVVKDSPAATAGIAKDDVVKKFDGQDVKDAPALTAAVTAAKPGDAAKVTVLRGTETKDFDVKLAQRPAPRVKVQSGFGVGGVLPFLSQLPQLQGIPAGEGFKHFLGGQFSLTDKDGKAFTVELTPGTVSTVDSAKLTLDVNGPAAAKKDFAVPANAANNGATRVSNLKVGDQVVVVTVGQSNEVSAIVRAGGMGLRVPMGGLGGFFHQGQPKQAPNGATPVPQPKGPGA